MPAKIIQFAKEKAARIVKPAHVVCTIYIESGALAKGDICLGKTESGQWALGMATSGFDASDTASALSRTSDPIDMIVGRVVCVETDYDAE